MNRPALLLFSSCVLLSSLCLATEVPADKGHWERSDAIQFLPYQGKQAMTLFGGVYAAKDTDMADGRVEADVLMHGERGFIGMVFHYQSDGDYELVYLRPHKTGLPDAVQYTPSFNRLSAWQLYADERYTAAAELPEDRWVHLAIEVRGVTASIYIDGRPEPVLVVRNLKRGLSRGAVGLWGDNSAVFANFRYTNYEAGPAQVVSPRANTPPGTLTAWQISDVYEAAFQPPNSPPRNARWEDVEVEDEGIVNVSRYRAKLLRNERREKSVNKDLVFARVRIHSDHDQVKKLWLGYSDEVLAMLNGTPIYEGKASFGHRYPFSLGIVGTDNDAIYLPLKKGDNELVLAVSEIFGGWGFVGRFDDLSGLRLPD